MSITTRKLCLTAVGIALYAVLALCLQVPVFENYYLCLGYAAMAVYCRAFGPFTGMCVGSLGVVLYCLVTNGLRGMPGWAAGNLVIGWILGTVLRRTKHLRSSLLRWSIDAAAVVTATVLGILVVKSGVEYLLYAQPFLFRAAKNVYAFAADVFMLLVSLPLCARLEGQLRRYFPELMQ